MRLTTKGTEFAKGRSSTDGTDERHRAGKRSCKTHNELRKGSLPPVRVRPAPCPPSPFIRPAAYETDTYQWNLRRVPATAVMHDRPEPHPARRCAIFVVHGMGEQQWTETSATLRSGFEDALEAIREWQIGHPDPDQPDSTGKVPPPFIYEGYWANYANLKATFPEDWKRFNSRERKFFKHLWTARAYSAVRTYLWMLGQQVRLLHPRNIRESGFATWLLIYCPLQIISFLRLTLVFLRAPRVLTRILADVRLYACPQGIAECAIIQRIDCRVGREFLRLIGLDWEFRPLPPAELVTASGQPFVFDRVVWVAHSLGTVVSYNVLSDLFRRAAAVEKTGDDSRKSGAKKFRDSLRRFITLGSPPDKFAFLFPEALGVWPTHERSSLLDGGDTFADGSGQDAGDTKGGSREWWINFYHVLDPVSGALNSQRICGGNPPANIHTDCKSTALVPGLAHVSYWSAISVLRLILGRTYGRADLRD